MKTVVSAKVMRRSDTACINAGTDGRVLVERAAAAVFSACDLSASPVAILCGSGNNGADGYALSLLLKNANIDCTTIAVLPPRSDECKHFCALSVDASVPHLDYESGTSMLRGAKTIIDCIFGTGFRGEADGAVLEAVREINIAKRGGARVISIDIPSGLSGTSGLGGEFVRADTTCSIGAIKQGHLFGHGKDAVGEVIVLDIGIPIVGESSMLCDALDFTSVIKKRENYCHKGNFGYITLLGGCTNYSGALKLAENASASLRSGCGVCRVALARSTVALVAPRLIDATLTTVYDEGGDMLFDKEGIDRAIRGAAALGIGMGWGGGAHCEEILSYIIKSCDIPILIDADGLNALSRIGADILRDARAPIVLTPHPKEFERLSGVPVSDVLDDPVGHARAFASEYGVTVLLKGASTVITDGYECYITDRGAPGMAVGGSGDVLSGIITSLLGYSSASLPLTAACGAWIAGRAGELAEAASNPVSMIASDTVRSIPNAVGEIYEYHTK